MGFVKHDRYQKGKNKKVSRIQSSIVVWFKFKYSILSCTHVALIALSRVSTIPTRILAASFPHRRIQES